MANSKWRICGDSKIWKARKRPQDGGEQKKDSLEKKDGRGALLLENREHKRRNVERGKGRTDFKDNG